MAFLGSKVPKTLLSSEPWWKVEKSTERAKTVIAVLDWLRQRPEEVHRQERAVHHARLYGNRFFRDFSPFGYARGPKHRRRQRLTANVCRSVVDAATAKIAKNRPLASLLTNDGSWDQAQRAKRLTLFVEGGFQDLDLYSLGPKNFRTAGIFGDGFLKFFAEHGKIKADKVLPCTVFVDPLEGVNGKPRCFYQEHFIDRHVLLELFGGSNNSKVREAIKRAGVEKDPHHGGEFRSLAEPIRVVEAWHLPSGPDATDGLHVMAIEGAELRKPKVWTRDRFPFVRFTWSDAEVGYWGTGLVEEVELLQLAINRTLKRIDDCLRLMAVPRILVDSTSKVVTSMITNEVGAILKYQGGQGGNPPQFMVPPAVPPELFAHLQWLIRTSFESTGISQLGAQSQKPAGLDSGRALLVFNDIESERFAIVGREYERFYMRCADQILDLAEEIDKDSSTGFSVVNRNRTHAERLDWDDVRMDREDYVLQVHPTSALPRDVAGRTTIVQQWLAMGHIDQRTAAKLLDFPDLDAHTARAFAAMEIVERHVGRFLDPGRDAEDPDTYLPPEPFDDLEFAIGHILMEYHRARLDDAPEERLELFRQWLGDAEALLAQAAPPPPPMGAEAPPLAPPGSPAGLSAVQPPATGLAA